MEHRSYYDYLIVGGGVAGVSAAEEIRRLDPHGTILIISQEKHPLYSRVLLPHYVRGKIDRERVFLRSFDQYAKARIEVEVDSDVVAVNTDTKEVVTSLKKEFGYKKLLIAAGGTPAPYPVPDGVRDRVFRFQTIEDADALRAKFQESKTKKDRIIIVGGGFIAFELIESAATYGCPADVLLKGDKYFGDVLDDFGWDIVLKRFKEYQILPHPSSALGLIEPTEHGVASVTSRKERLAGGWIGVGIGLERNLQPFIDSGMVVERGIKVNQYLETSQEHIWAAGDVVEYFDPIFGEYRALGNWTNAVMQGKVAGSNMVEGRKEFRMVSTYSITNLGYHYTFVGKTEGAIKDDVIRVWPNDTAYERLFFNGGILEGAVMINRFKDKPLLTTWIEQKKDLSAFKESLRDPDVPIESIS